MKKGTERANKSKLIKNEVLLFSFQQFIDSETSPDPKGTATIKDVFIHFPIIQQKE